MRLRFHRQRLQFYRIDEENLEPRHEGNILQKDKFTSYNQVFKLKRYLTMDQIAEGRLYQIVCLESTQITFTKILPSFIT